MTPEAKRTITAMFDTRAEAERAAETLRGMGIAANEIHIRADEAHATGTAAGDDKGFWASVGDLFVPEDDRATYGEGLRRGATLLTAEVDAARLESAMDALEEAGSVDLDEREAGWRAEGWGGASSTNPPGTMASRAVDQVAGSNVSGAYPQNEARTGTAALAANVGADGEQRIRLAEETMRVGKREAHQGRVKVRSYVVETPVEETVQLREERVHVERHALDQAATGDDAELFRDRVIEADESIEEAVIAKDVRVTGEVVVNKTVTERDETVRDTVRRTEVEVDDKTTGAKRRQA